MVLMVSDDGTNLGLDDGPESLLDFLQNRREAVNWKGVQSVSRLSFGVEVTVYDCLIRQLYRERVCGSARVRELATKLAEYAARVKELATKLVEYVNKLMRQTQ